MSDIFSLPVSKISEQIKDAKITSVDLCKVYIDRINKFEKDVKAWVYFDKKLLLEKAKESDDYKSTFDSALKYIEKESCPYVILVKKNTFSKINSTPKNTTNNTLPLTREYVLKKIIGALPNNAIIVSTTGKTSREIYEIFYNFNSSVI